MRRILLHVPVVAVCSSRGRGWGGVGWGGGCSDRLLPVLKSTSPPLWRPCGEHVLSATLDLPFPCGLLAGGYLIRAYGPVAIGVVPAGLALLATLLLPLIGVAAVDKTHEA